MFTPFILQPSTEDLDKKARTELRQSLLRMNEEHKTRTGHYYMDPIHIDIDIKRAKYMGAVGLRVNKFTTVERGRPVLNHN
jgi:hypothetical protein